MCARKIDSPSVVKGTENGKEESFEGRKSIDPRVNVVIP